MNRRIVFNIIGRMIAVEAALLLLPIFVSVYFNEACVTAFIITALIALAVGLGFMFLIKPKTQVIYAREGYAIVAFAWILMSAIGALPFVISGEIPNYIDALFETVSGFTTTGASIVPNVELLSKGILFWRSFTHWIGGMGILVFIMAIIPNFTDRSIHIMRAEMPGPIVGKLVPRVKDTAKILYLIYIVLTFLQIILLVLGDMPLFDSVIHTFGTAGTGGFGIKADSIAGYNHYCQWVITVFMILFGINFNIFYLVLLRKFKSIFKSSELWCYLGIILFATATITLNIRSTCAGLEEAFRLSAFQVSSIITTTGFATANFDIWPTLSKSILLLLMFVGACAGSTGGGFKVSRVVLLFKTIKQELKNMIHPRSISTVKFEGRTVDERTVRSVGSYLAIYIVCFVFAFLILSFDRYNIETNFSAVAACFNNIGPGFSAVGPAANYAGYSIFSKLTLTFSMLLGRLEILPLILALSPATWKRK